MSKSSRKGAAPPASASPPDVPVTDCQRLEKIGQRLELARQQHDKAWAKLSQSIRDGGREPDWLTVFDESPESIRTLFGDDPHWADYQRARVARDKLENEWRLAAEPVKEAYAAWDAYWCNHTISGAEQQTKWNADREHFQCLFRKPVPAPIGWVEPACEFALESVEDLGVYLNGWLTNLMRCRQDATAFEFARGALNNGYLWLAANHVEERPEKPELADDAEGVERQLGNLIRFLETAGDGWSREMSPKELANRLEISLDTLKKRIDAGVIPVQRITTKRIKVRRDALPKAPPE